MGKRIPILIISSILFLLSVILLNVGSQKTGVKRNFGKSVNPTGPTEDELKTARLTLLGDIMLGRTVLTKSISVGDYLYPFKKVAPRLKEADLVFANLESPVVSNCPMTETGMIFCTRPEMLDGLTFVGVKVVSLANNHSHNYGMEGYEATKKYLSEKGIEWVDERNLYIRDVDGLKFGFLGFNFTSQGPTADDLLFIAESKSKVDILILGVHWGVEYTPISTEVQKTWAVQLIGSGADVLSGTHPHWIQNIEYINEKPVYYSLGNFVFDQMWSEETKKGMVVSLTFEGDKRILEERDYIYMTSWAQPGFVD